MVVAAGMVASLWKSKNIEYKNILKSGRKHGILSRIQFSWSRPGVMRVKFKIRT